MYTNRQVSRFAGLLYLLIIVTGIFHLMYVPAQLIDWQNPVLTYQNLLNSTLLFKFGILAGLLCYIAFLFLPILLYSLFRHLNQFLAVAMLAFALVSVPICLLNLGNKLDVLTLIHNANIKQADLGNIQEQVMLKLRFYNNGDKIASIFWGIWLFPLGILVFRSGVFSKALGVLLMVGCLGYLTNFLGGFLVIDYSKSALSDYVTIPGSIAEIGLCLSLIWYGFRRQPLIFPNQTQPE